MADDIEIPESHWRQDSHVWRNFVSVWEPQLRKNLRDEPDPAKRFEVWLKRKVAGEGGQGVRLIFLEQPYLNWAEMVERVIKATEKSTREAIAYEITHPDDE